MDNVYTGGHMSQELKFKFKLKLSGMHGHVYNINPVYNN